MSQKNTNNAAVRREMLKGKSPSDAASTLDSVCTTAAQSPEVQASPIATNALTALKQAAAKVAASVDTKKVCAQALATAGKTLSDDMRAAKVALGVFQSIVGSIALGNAAIINKAGLPARDAKPPAAPLERVTGVSSKPGKKKGEAIITWPAASGATGYGLEVNLTPESPAGPWTALTSATGRRRTVKASAPGGEVLVRVCAQGSRGEQAEWSDAILATAR